MKMQNPIQAYAWGSRSAIAELLGQDLPSPEPQAELWMGAHPKSPSKVWIEGRWHFLNDLIEHHPDEMLGHQVVDRFGETLPYLFKVLAAAEPLSIQAHPDAQQALAGFQRENRIGIPVTDPQRNYRDDQPKPECMCALTPFHGLCGFRAPREVLEISELVWPEEHVEVIGCIDNSNSTTILQELFSNIMQMEASRINNLVARVVERAEGKRNQNDAYLWVCALNQKYPGDVGVLSPLLLNIIKLEPGEALFLPPRQLHAYLDGLGIELMANSDNVLRGGLTPKHIDVQELTRILDFAPYKPEILTPQSKGSTEGVYTSSTDAFSLSALQVTHSQPHIGADRFRGPEILLVVDGTARINLIDGDAEVSVRKGESVFIPAIVDAYHIKGEAALYKAAVNMDPGDP